MNSTNTNAGGWKNCAMRSTHLPAILALMPSEVRAGIKEVNKLSSAGSQSSSIDTTADKLFLLSEIEIFGSTTYSKSGEGSQYAYYTAGNTKVKRELARRPAGGSARRVAATRLGSAVSPAAAALTTAPRPPRLAWPSASAFNLKPEKIPRPVRRGIEGRTSCPYTNQNEAKAPCSSWRQRGSWKHTPLRAA